MVTNYSQYDKLRGNEVFGLPICLALAAGLLFGAIKYCNNYRDNETSQEVRAVQNQKYNINNSNNLERLTIKEKYRKK